MSVTREDALTMSALDVNDNSAVYYEGNYWNNLDCTIRMINRRISGDDAVNWWQHFASRVGRTFQRALILNCGNGWVEREMVEAGFVKEAVGIDYSDDLLAQARAAAGSLPIRYEQVNINKDPLPSGGFDLVVNHAAAHHITMVDRVFRDLCSALSEDGWFISFDYVGPHRNQYTTDAWDHAWQVNEQLPENVRQNLVYPDLSTMLFDDPTEAVHSELILETLRRYFRVDELVPIGGAIAYPLLTFNQRLFSLPNLQEREKWGQYVLDRDAEYLLTHPESTLFAYFTAQPEKAALAENARLEKWQAEEAEREARAASNGGKYGERTLMQDVYGQINQLQQANSDLQAQLDAIKSSYLYSHLVRALAHPAVGRMLRTKLARRVVDRAKRSPE
jgi:SAM-dependent methyltransferase